MADCEDGRDRARCRVADGADGAAVPRSSRRAGEIKGGPARGGRVERRPDVARPGAHGLPRARAADDGPPGCLICSRAGAEGGHARHGVMRGEPPRPSPSHAGAAAPRSAPTGVAGVAHRGTCRVALSPALRPDGQGCCRRSVTLVPAAGIPAAAGRRRPAMARRSPAEALAPAVRSVGDAGAERPGDGRGAGAGAAAGAARSLRGVRGRPRVAPCAAESCGHGARAAALAWAARCRRALTREHRRDRRVPKGASERMAVSATRQRP
eukprot:scaffold7117_cov390-Prasinococcus_capsulatus_cf.AAC.1